MSETTYTVHDLPTATKGISKKKLAFRAAVATLATVGAVAIYQKLAPKVVETVEGVEVTVNDQSA